MGALVLGRVRRAPDRAAGRPARPAAAGECGGTADIPSVHAPAGQPLSPGSGTAHRGTPDDSRWISEWKLLSEAEDVPPEGSVGATPSSAQGSRRTEVRLTNQSLPTRPTHLGHCASSPPRTRQTPASPTHRLGVWKIGWQSGWRIAAGVLVAIGADGGLLASHIQACAFSCHGPAHGECPLGQCRSGPRARFAAAAGAHSALPTGSWRSGWQRGRRPSWRRRLPSRSNRHRRS